MEYICKFDTKLSNISVLYKDPNYIDGYYYLNNIDNGGIKISEKE
jgi:hypothetical protein